MPTLREWLATEPYTLAMSSGFFSFFTHAGFLSVLEDERLLPARICGSSAGALIGGLFAAGLGTADIQDALHKLRRGDFWDPTLGLGLLRGQRFEALLERLLPVTTFEACRLPLAISVFEVRTRQTVVLRGGPLASALHASCAVPLLFQPVRVGPGLYLDGGVLDRPGLAGADDQPRILYHHIKSRSPWRRRQSLALRIPQRSGLQAIALDGIPRLGPFRLDQGREAMRRAAEATRAALAQPV